MSEAQHKDTVELELDIEAMSCRADALRNDNAKLQAEMAHRQNDCTEHLQRARSVEALSIGNVYRSDLRKSKPFPER